MDQKRYLENLSYNPVKEETHHVRCIQRSGTRLLSSVYLLFMCQQCPFFSVKGQPFDTPTNTPRTHFASVTGHVAILLQRYSSIVPFIEVFP